MPKMLIPEVINKHSHIIGSTAAWKNTQTPSSQKMWTEDQPCASCRVSSAAPKAYSPDADAEHADPGQQNHQPTRPAHNIVRCLTHAIHPAVLIFNLSETIRCYAHACLFPAIAVHRRLPPGGAGDRAGRTRSPSGDESTPRTDSAVLGEGRVKHFFGTGKKTQPVALPERGAVIASTAGPAGDEGLLPDVCPGCRRKSVRTAARIAIPPANR